MWTSCATIIAPPSSVGSFLSSTVSLSSFFLFTIFLPPSSTPCLFIIAVVFAIVILAAASLFFICAALFLMLFTCLSFLATLFILGFSILAFSRLMFSVMPWGLNIFLSTKLSDSGKRAFFPVIISTVKLASVFVVSFPLHNDFLACL